MSRGALWLVVIGCLVRLTYLAEHAASPFFGSAVLDELYYDTVARLLLLGQDISEVNPGFRPLLYPFYLAASYAVASFAGVGEWGRELAVFGQHLLGIGTALLVMALAERIYPQRGVGFAAGLVYLLAGPPLFFEGELLIAALASFLLAAFLLFLARLASSGNWRDGIVAGVLLVTAAQARPNVIVLLAALVLAACLGARQRGGQAATVPVVTSVVVPSVLAVGLAAVCWGAVQAPWTQRFQLLGGSGGVNLYLGNKAGADGMIPRQDRATTYAEEYRDSVQVFAEEIFREDKGRAATDSAELSSYWTGRALAEIRTDPAAWLALMARKWTYLTWNAEIPNNKTYAFAVQHESALLRWLPVRWWLLFALAPLGIAVAWREAATRPAVLSLAAAVLLYGAIIVLFFVNSRFRIPLWPVLSVFAAGGGWALLEAVRERQRRAVLWGAGVAVLAVISWVNWWGVELPGFERDFFFRSIAHLERGNAEAALADAQASVALRDDDAAAWYQLGTAALALDDGPTAWEAFVRAAQLQPEEPRVWNSLGVALERQGRFAEAYAAYHQALQRLQNFAPAMVNAALLELRAGLVERAGARLRQIPEHESPAAFVAWAVIAERQGRNVEAEGLRERARAVDPEGTGTLLRDLERPLVPLALGLGRLDQRE